MFGPMQMQMNRERSDCELLDDWHVLAEDISTLRAQMLALEGELFQRMRSRDASAIDHDNVECKLEPQEEVDRAALRGIIELEGIPQDVLAEAFTPEHTETVTVPDKWNLTKLKPLQKYNGAVTTIIDSARQQLDPRPVFKLKQRKGKGN